MGTGRSLLFGAGQLGMMLLARFFFQWVIRFADQGGEGGEPLLNPASVGLLFFGFRLFDGITDPVAGTLSDAWVRKGRQRRTLLWFSFLLPPLGLALVFAPHSGMAESARWALIAIGMFVFFLGYTLYAIPYWSLIDDYSEGNQTLRARLSTILGVTLLMATALGFVLSPDLVEAHGFFVASLLFAVPAAALMALPYFAAPRLAQRPPATEATEVEGGMAGFLAAFRHRRFLATMVIFTGSQMSFTVLTGAVPYIAVELLGGELSDQKWLLGPFIAAAIPCFAFVPRLAVRYGWERIVVAASWALGAVYVGTGLLGSGLLGSPLLTASVVFACGGPMAAALLALESEAVAGCAREREGEVTSVYFGVFNLMVKGFNGLALYLTGLLAAAVPTHGLVAVRSMGWLAGGCLAAGVLLYLVLRPRPAAPAMSGA